MVVGAKMKYMDNSTFDYRVDYDDKKGLHINLNLKIYFSKNDFRDYEYALVLKDTPKDSLYYVDKSTEKYSSEDQLELIKYKAFVKISLGYLKARTNNLVLTEEKASEDETIISFITQKPFNMKILKRTLIKQLDDKKYNKLIEDLKAVNTSSNLVEMIHEDKHLRKRFVKIITDVYQGFLEKNHKLENVADNDKSSEVHDSEHLSDPLASELVEELPKRTEQNPHKIFSAKYIEKDNNDTNKHNNLNKGNKKK
jgi:hypothetical protein